MCNWSQFPLFRLLLPFVFGIIAVVFFGVNIPLSPYYLVLLILIVFILAYFTRSFATYRYRWFFGVLVSFSFFLLGSQISINNNNKNHNTHFERQLTEVQTVIAQLTEPIHEGQNSNKTYVKIISVKNGNKWLPTNGNAIFYFEKDSLSASLDYGDRILCYINFNEISAPQNPSEFNYKRYLAGKQIFHRAYLAFDSWELLSSGNGSKIKAIAIETRAKFLEIIYSNDIKGQEFAVLSALLLGDKAYLDEETISEFSGAGATHILCVSGLHVGIIYLLLNGLLLFLEKKRYGKISKAVILILIIWAYAMLTGIAPSVLRASTMFSFIIIGKTLKRYTNVYNSLAVSAFILDSSFLILQLLPLLQFSQ